MIWLWQLPQHILGYILILCTNASRCLDDRYVWVAYANWARDVHACCGDIIVIGQGVWGDFILEHEKMHQRQSHLLGPLYLFTVGVYSLIRNIFGRLMNKPVSWYYNTWPENWIIGDSNEDNDN